MAKKWYTEYTFMVYSSPADRFIIKTILTMLTAATNSPASFNSPHLPTPLFVSPKFKLNFFLLKILCKVR